MREKLLVIGIDLDGFLCEGDAWNPKQCLKAKPIEKNIALANELYEKNFTVIFTSRRDPLLPATLEWLRRNNIQWCAISNKKTPCDLYYDDRCQKF